MRPTSSRTQDAHVWLCQVIVDEVNHQTERFAKATVVIEHESRSTDDTVAGHIVTKHVTRRVTSKGEGKHTARFELRGGDELSCGIKKKGGYAPVAGLPGLYLVLITSRRPSCL